MGSSEERIETVVRGYLHEAPHDDELKQEIAAAYYDDEISFDQLAELVGYDSAANFRVLKRQLEASYIDEIAAL